MTKAWHGTKEMKKQALHSAKEKRAAKRDKKHVAEMPHTLLTRETRHH